MKKPLILFLFLVASHFGITAVYAQKKLKPKEVIVLEITTSNSEYVDKREILINRNPKDRFEYLGGRGDGAGVGCGDCSPEHLAELEKAANI